MALKKRFREAARNEFRFFFFLFLLFLVVLIIVTTVATSLYLYFSIFVPSFNLRLQERSKVGACCAETDSVCLTEKIEINHQILFLIWIFLKVWSIKLPFRRLFWVFWFELKKCLEKIIFSLLFCFSQLWSLFFFSQFCKP